MRRALTYCILAAALGTQAVAAPRHSWNQIRYVGGTVPVKPSRYDWDTTLTVNPDSIVLVFTPPTVFKPGFTLRLKPSQVTSLTYGLTAWRRVAEVSGAVLPAKAPSLLGMLPDWVSVGIVYRTEDGKPGAVLLETGFNGQILRTLKQVTGKPVEGFP